MLVDAGMIEVLFCRKNGEIHAKNEKNVTKKVFEKNYFGIIMKFQAKKRAVFL